MKCIKPRGYILKKKLWILILRFFSFFLFFEKKIIVVAQPPLWATWGGRITPLAKMWVARPPPRAKVKKNKKIN
jgi:hypothetical protein